MHFMINLNYIILEAILQRWAERDTKRLSETLLKFVSFIHVYLSQIADAANKSLFCNQCISGTTSVFLHSGAMTL